MKAILWSRYHCPYCDQARALLELKGVEFEERKIGDGWSREDLIEMAPNSKTVPQIFFDDELIGGFNDLKRYFQRIDHAD
jgi:glutaredoxin